MPRQYRRLRFSLRTLFVVVTMVAVALWFASRVFAWIFPDTFFTVNWPWD